MTCACRSVLGLSAQAIRWGGKDYPHDPSDLCRCLAVSPNPPLHMIGRSPEWRVLVEHWTELADLLAEEHPTGSAPKTYARMKELFAIARGKEPPKMTDTDSPTDKCACGHVRWQHKRSVGACRGEPGPTRCDCAEMTTTGSGDYPRLRSTPPDPRAMVSEPRAFAKRDDPGTSWAAAYSIDGKQLKSRYQAVLRLIKAFGPCHNDELAEHYQRVAASWDLPQQTAQSVRSRRSELTAMGLVVDTGERATLASGRQAVIWALADA